MPNTYTQIYIHYVFATGERYRLLTEERQKELYAYSAGIIKELGCFLQCIGGMEDHIHLLVGLHPTLSVSEFAQKVKANTSRFINQKDWAIGKFKWQEGFGAFSVSQSGLGMVRNYIKNQKEHHQGQSFANEYETLLVKHQIDYNTKYLFQENLIETDK
ncbi:MAG: IS200/IS605 family transposase [Candidatus Cloacimonadaceae bacterium]|jgi:REP element-mobilizing transposase RayT|nr:IS200/IS605 family transposase [Candidatus Cloacimonadaceae bacterium]